MPNVGNDIQNAYKNAVSSRDQETSFGVSRKLQYTIIYDTIKNDLLYSSAGSQDHSKNDNCESSLEKIVV